MTRAQVIGCLFCITNSFSLLSAHLLSLSKDMILESQYFYLYLRITPILFYLSILILICTSFGKISLGHEEGLTRINTVSQLTEVKDNQPHPRKDCCIPPGASLLCYNL